MNPEANIEIYKAIEAWNPINLKDIDAEIYEMMDYFYQETNQEALIDQIQALFNFSFEQNLSRELIQKIVSEVQHIQLQYEVLPKK